MQNTYKYQLKGLGCANCAAKMEADLTNQKGFSNVSIHFPTERLRLESALAEEKTEKIVNDVVHKYEPEVQVTNEEHAYDHDHDHGAFRPMLIRWLIGLGFFIAALAVGDRALQVPLFVLSYVIAGYSVLLAAARNIIRGNPFDENFLMSVATIGAIAIGEWSEGCAVMLFYLFGEMMQARAVDSSRRSIQSLLEIRPDVATVLDGQEEKSVPAEEVTIGSRIVVRPGDRVPLDGKVVEGSSFVDASALTGESVPVRVDVGQEILSGALNQQGRLVLETSKDFSNSTVARILHMVEDATSKKAPTEQFITKFARYYTPAVVFAAVALAIVPPLLFGGAWSTWVYRALVFLVVSCPCALVVSIPLGFFAGIGRASKEGILVKGGNYLEALQEVDMVVFDKTGTLTKGEFSVAKVLADDETALLDLLAHAEMDSTHPIAQSVIEVHGKELDRDRVGSVEEIAGRGIRAVVDGKEILAGNAALLEGIEVPQVADGETVVYVAVDGVYKGAVVIADALKDDAKAAIRGLEEKGIRTAMLSGDRVEVANAIGKELGLDEVRAGLLPAEKVLALEELAKSAGKVAFVGDGINDAPVLARADVGIAMGGLGSDAAIEAADVVLMTDEPRKIVDAIAISKYTRKIVTQNIVFSLGIKAIVLLLSAIGYADMWLAVFADVGVAALAVLNSTRILRYKS